MGVYYYQLVATLAQRGGPLRLGPRQPSAATAADIYNNAILPMAVGLNTTT